MVTYTMMLSRLLMNEYQKQKTNLNQDQNRLIIRTFAIIPKEPIRRFSAIQSFLI